MELMETDKLKMETEKIKCLIMAGCTKEEIMEKLTLSEEGIDYVKAMFG